MKPHSCIAILAIFLTSCANTGEQWKATGSFVAKRLGSVIAQTVINSAVQSLTGGEKADFLDSAAQGLRTLPANVTSDDIAHVIAIWSTPPKEATPPEMKAAASKAVTTNVTTGATPEVLAQAFNEAAAKVRENEKTP